MQANCHSDSDSCAPEVMVSDARVFSSIKYEQKYPWLYNSVVHQGYLCTFCELFCGHSSSSQQWPNNGVIWPSKKSRKLVFQREENIELSIYKLAYRRGHWAWRLWLIHWKTISFYPFTLYLWLPIIFLIWPADFWSWWYLATKIKIPLWGLW